MEKQFAITSSGKTLRSFHDLRFGRCKYLVVHKPGAEISKLVENPFAEEVDADMQLAEFLRENQVTSIITGGVGQEVCNYLSKHKMQLILMDEEKIKIEDILTRLG
ncbi:MAG: NifB/NifX family molybdenum-iron cluster-binding protein [Bacteroidota bacterium]